MKAQALSAGAKQLLETLQHASTVCSEADALLLLSAEKPLQRKQGFCGCRTAARTQTDGRQQVEVPEEGVAQEAVVHDRHK